MPDIFFYLDDEHWKKYKQIDDETKRKINTKIRKAMYRELDKARS